VKKLLAIIVLGLLLSGSAYAAVKYKKTEFKIDDLVLKGYQLFASELDGSVVGNGVYVFIKQKNAAQSIFHCYVAMKALPRKVETCYNLTPSIKID
jgi:hypothetical protein